MSFKRLCHWGPICVLAIIKLITWAMVHLIGMWWPPNMSLGGALHAVMFLSLAASTLYFFMQALLEGPGFLPLGWKPAVESDTEYLQYCLTCKGYKAPRSHHCSKCGHCVKKMDHHCPWINCCVGHNNHGYFTMFLISAVMGCLHASIVLSICLYHAIHRAWYIMHGTGREPLVHVTLTTLMGSLLAVGMALGVVLAVGALLYLQIRSILRNCTTIEDWILDKAACRREEEDLPPFRFPYDLGWRRNAHLVWAGRRHDGIHWPVLEGLGQYDLTVEQKAQKVSKAGRARVFVATYGYGGGALPLLQYTRAALAPPCAHEPRLRLRAGDRLRATRQRRHWLFGEKLPSEDELPRRLRGDRGWFPRAAVTPAPYQDIINIAANITNNTANITNSTPNTTNITNNTANTANVKTNANNIVRKKSKPD